MTFVWACDLCGKPIADGAGYIEVDDGAAVRNVVLQREEDQRTREKYPGPLTPIPLSDIAVIPRISWVALHAACDPDPGRSTYWIAVERIRTLNDVLAWNAHLHGKDWAEQTNWDDFILERLGDGSFP